MVRGRAWIPVVAGCSVWQVGQETKAASRLTARFTTLGIEDGRTLHYRTRTDGTFRREGSLVADNDAIATIAVVKGGAIGISLALAQPGIPGHADSRLAHITCRAQVAVVTGEGVVNVQAGTGERVAPVIGAWIAVIAVGHPGPGGADSPLAQVTESAGVPIIAHGPHGQELATQERVTHTLSTRVLVVTHNGGTDTGTGHAEVIGGAGIRVIAGPTNGVVKTISRGQVTDIQSARIAVLAHLCWPTKARSLGAEITHCTRIAVVTGQRIGQGLAASQGIAGIGSAGVIILALQHLFTDADSGNAVVAQGAGVAVIAQRTVKERSLTRTGLPVAHRSLAWAGAGAGHQFPLTALWRALVVDGARVLIVTGRPWNQLVVTAGNGVAGFNCARVAIGTIDGIPQTHSVTAEVVSGTEAAVIAWLCKPLVGTLPSPRHTQVQRTVIAIITVPREA